MPKMLIDLQKGLIDVEGEEDFVERVYADIRDALVSQLKLAPLSRVAEPSEVAHEDGGDKNGGARKPRRRVKGSGPSCASRIDALKGEAFFSEARSASEVADKLREKGTTYEQKHVSAALIDLTKRGKLRRFQQEGWKYQAS